MLAGAMGTRFHNDPTTLADDRALVLEAISLALLRATPLLLILSAMGMAAIAGWLSDKPEPFLRFAELVATGALGNLAPSFSDKLIRIQPAGRPEDYFRNRPPVPPAPPGRQGP